MNEIRELNYCPICDSLFEGSVCICGYRVKDYGVKQMEIEQYEITPTRERVIDQGNGKMKITTKIVDYEFDKANGSREKSRKLEISLSRLRADGTPFMRQIEKEKDGKVIVYQFPDRKVLTLPVECLSDFRKMLDETLLDLKKA